MRRTGAHWRQVVWDLLFTMTTILLYFVSSQVLQSQQLYFHSKAANQNMMIAELISNNIKAAKFMKTPSLHRPLPYRVSVMALKELCQQVLLAFSLPYHKVAGNSHSRNLNMKLKPTPRFITERILHWQSFHLSVEALQEDPICSLMGAKNPTFWPSRPLNSTMVIIELLCTTLLCSN